MNLHVNGRLYVVRPDGDEPLLWTLRDRLGLTGTKYGCGIGLCGCCTVLLDGAPVRACQVLTVSVGEARVQTIEDMADPDIARVRRAWIDAQVPQCGYCQPGFVMATAGVMKSHPAASADEILTGVTNLCRCGTQDRIRTAVGLLVEARP